MVAVSVMFLRGGGIAVGCTASHQLSFNEFKLIYFTEHIVFWVLSRITQYVYVDMCFLLFLCYSFREPWQLVFLYIFLYTYAWF